MPIPQIATGITSLLTLTSCHHGFPVVPATRWGINGFCADNGASNVLDYRAAWEEFDKLYSHMATHSGFGPAIAVSVKVPSNALTGPATLAVCSLDNNRDLAYTLYWANFEVVAKVKAPAPPEKLFRYARNGVSYA